MPKNQVAALKPTQEDSEQQQDDTADADEDDKDVPGNIKQKNSSAASRLNAIVNAATFLSNADPDCKEKLVEIVKTEFFNFTGYVSKHYRALLTVCN